MNARNITKRRFLALLGAGVGGVGLGQGTVTAESTYSETVDIVDAGADNTGNEPINDVLESVVADDTLVEFPPGTYLMEREFVYDDARNVGLVSTDGSNDTTILIEDTFQDKNLFDFGSSGSNAADGITLKGFTVDMTMSGAGTCIFWGYCLDDCRIEDIVVDGVLQGELPSGKGEILVRVDVMNSDGTGLIRDFAAPDGAEYAGSGSPATGIYIGGAHAGKVTIENCEIAGFHDNGVYTSAAAGAGGDVVIRGGRYANNDVSNVRVGGTDTLVENVTVVQDSTDGMPYNNPRGIYARNGNCTIRDVSIDYYEGDSEAIQAGTEMGSVDLQNVRIHQKTNEMTLFFRPNTSSFTADGLTIVAEGTGRQVLDVEDWTSSIINSCIQATDGDRDGLLFTSADAEVSDSTVDVAGTAVDGATTTNVSYDGGCSLSNDTDVAVSTGSASSVDTSDATLNGTLDDLGGASSADVRFDYREVGVSSWTATDSQTLSTTGSFSSVVSGLSSGTDYEFRAVADATDGDVDIGTTNTFTTATSDTSVAVSTDPESGVGTDSATLNGTLGDLGGANSADVYFEYGESGESLSNSTATQTLSSTGSFDTTVSGLASGTDYEFRAVADATDGDVDTGTTDTFTTDSSDTNTAPTVDSYAVSEAGSPNPHFEATADWAVGDADGNLSTVTVDVVDSKGRVVDSATTTVSGASASGSDSFKIKHVNGATFDVALTVVDDRGDAASATRTVSE